MSSERDALRRIYEALDGSDLGVARRLLHELALKLESTKEQRLREVAALAWSRLIVELKTAGELEAAIVEGRALLGVFEDVHPREKPDLPLDTQFQLVSYAQRAGRNDDACDAAEELVARYSEPLTAHRRMLVGESLWVMASTYRRRGDDAEEETSLRHLVDLTDNDQTEWANSMRARALHNLAVRLQAANLLSDAGKVWQRLADEFDRQPPTDRPELPLQARCYEAQAWLKDGQVEAAQTATQLLVRMLTGPVPPKAARVLLDTAWVLVRTGMLAPAASIFAKLLTVSEREGQRGSRQWTEAALGRGFALARSGNLGDAQASIQLALEAGEPVVEVLDELLVERDSGRDDSDMVAWLSLARAATIATARSTQAGIDAQRQFLARYATSDSPFVRELIHIAQQGMTPTEET